MPKQPEPAVDLPLWRTLRAIGVRLRRLAGLPPPPPDWLDPKIIPFRPLHHRHPPFRRFPR